MLRPSRAPRGEDARLLWRMGLFLAGAAFGIAGMATEYGPLTWFGIVLLAAGLLLRFISPPKRRDS